MTAAIWSTPPDKCGLGQSAIFLSDSLFFSSDDIDPPSRSADALNFADFPAKTLVRFMHNHHLLQVTNKPLWLVVKGGRYVLRQLEWTLSSGGYHLLTEWVSSCSLSFHSSSYIPPVISKLAPDAVHTSTPIRSLESKSLSNGRQEIILTTAEGEKRVFDHVVMACHADETLKILGEGATEEEKEILGGFEFSSNRVVLHGDKQVRQHAWLAHFSPALDQLESLLIFLLIDSAHAYAASCLVCLELPYIVYHDGQRND